MRYTGDRLRPFSACALLKFFCLSHANTAMQMDKFQLFRFLLQQPFVASSRQDHFFSQTAAHCMQFHPFPHAFPVPSPLTSTGCLHCKYMPCTRPPCVPVAQAVIGGQPLLIVGVAEPIVLLYKFMYDFASDRPSLPQSLFLPWCAWACTWTACMLWATAASGACRYIYKFTRFSGELFGMLIATLFLQQAVQGLKEGFQLTSGTGAVT